MYSKKLADELIQTNRFDRLIMVSMKTVVSHFDLGRFSSRSVKLPWQ